MALFKGNIGQLNDGQWVTSIYALASRHRQAWTRLSLLATWGLLDARGHCLAAAPVHVEPELLHLVRVAVVLVARHTQVKVLTHGAVVPRLHGLGARVAVVHKLVLALRNTL